jgi:thioredoxin reductase (NADPH)
LPIHTYERVTGIVRESSAGQNRFRVRAERARGPQQYLARQVILAMGDMHRPRRLYHPGMDDVPGADLPHVSSYFVEPHPYAGCQLLIVGGRNSAIEAAIRCHRAGARVALCQRAAELSSSIKYWLKPEIEWLIQTGEIDFYSATAPVAITPTHVTLAPVNAAGAPDLASTAIRQVAADFVLLLIGYTMDPTLLQAAGVELFGPGLTPRIDRETMESNVPGLYVAGTAAAGTQLSFRLFIENCHAHVVRIVRHLTGQDPRHINPLAYSRLCEDPLAAES